MHFLLPSIDIRTTGNEKDIDHNMNEENRKMNRRKSCSKNEPSLMYEFHENKKLRNFVEKNCPGPERRLTDHKMRTLAE